MSTLLQPGQHPDADQLSAFAEHALPPHEQQQTLAHLATCPDCRALVYLAQEADPIESQPPHAVAARRSWIPRWLTGWSLAIPAAALACLILITLHLRKAATESGQATPPATTASNKPAAPPVTAPPERPAVTSIPPIRASSKAAIVTRRKKPNPIEMAAASGVSTATSAVAGAAAQAALGLQFVPQPQVSGEANLATGGSGGVQGRIVDPSGAVIPNAQVIATNTDTGVELARASDKAGIYTLGPLPPGKYNLEIVAPGFQRQLQENVMIAGNSMARLDPRLTLGAANETVTVTDAPPLLNTANATLGGSIENEIYSQLPLSTNGSPRDPTAFQYLMPGVQQAPAVTTTTAGVSANSGIVGGTGQTNLTENYLAAVPEAASGGAQAQSAALTITGSAMDASAMATGLDGLAPTRQLPTLPSKLPALSVVEIAARILAIDTAGTLFRTDDAGVTWHAVAAQWQGRALSIRLAQTRVATQSAPASNTASGAGAQRQAKITAAPAPAFELTTDSGAIYTSPDGQTWQGK